MNKEEKIDQEPKSLEVFKDEKPPKKKDAFQKITRDLTQEDLSNPGTQKLIINKLDSLEDEVKELENYRDKFHEKDKKVAILDEKVNNLKSWDILYSAMLTVGAYFLGLSYSNWNKDNYNGEFILIGGIILILAGIISRLLKK